MNNTSSSHNRDSREQKEQKDQKGQKQQDISKGFTRPEDGQRSTVSETPEATTVNGERDPRQHLASEGGVAHKVTENAPLGHSDENGQDQR